jgi:hypothetical protein
MMRYVRTRLIGTIGAIAMLATVAFAAAAARPAMQAAAAPSGLFFQSDLSITPAMHFDVEGVTFYYFIVQNTGISSGTVSGMTIDCGIHVDTGVEYAGQYHSLGSFTVPGNSSIVVTAPCVPPPHSVVTGGRIFGHVDGNDVHGPTTLSAQIGTLPY